VDRGPQVTPARKWASVIAAPLVGFGWRRGLRERRWGWGCLELSQRRAQRIKARGVGKSVVFDGAPDGRRHRDKLVVGQVNRRHGSASSPRHRITMSGESGDNAWIVGRLKNPSNELVLADPVWRQIGPRRVDNRQQPLDQRVASAILASSFGQSCSLRLTLPN
jgi:hypothetical protein